MSQAETATEGQRPESGNTAPALSRVWQPLTIGPVTAKNRVLVPARILNWAREDHVLSDRHLAHFKEIARGGTALIVTEQHAAHPISKGSFYKPCTAWDESAIPRFEMLAETVHEFGARSFVQLFGTGVHDKGTMIVDEWHPLWGVSRIPSVVHGEVPMVMDTTHIKEMVQGFGKAADNVRAGGLDGIEVHGAHGYLIGQFLSPTYNTRTDAYGGSVANRCRFAVEVGKEIRDRVGGELAVGLRLSYDEFLGAGGVTPDDADEQLNLLASTGLFDYFSISGGSYHTLHIAVAPMSVEDGHLLGFARRAKGVVGDRAVIFGVGRVRDLRMIEAALADGTADMIAMGRAHFADPHIVEKTRQGREDEIIRCTGVNECIGRALDGQEVICMMNPVTGRERQWGTGPPAVAPNVKKRVVVVGGGPGGMKTAETASRRGHDVTLLEREASLGGQFNLISQFPTRQGWEVAADDLRRAVANAGVEVELGVSADETRLREHKADVVVVATGARYERSGLSAYRPAGQGIDGVEANIVTDLETACLKALDDPSSLGSRVVISDESGAYLPLGLAELLAKSGVEVEIVSPHLFVGQETYRHLELFHLYPRLRNLGVSLTPQHVVEKVANQSVVVNDMWSNDPREIRDVSCVVLSMYRTPDDELYEQIKDSFDYVYCVGDCVAPRKPAAVIYDAEKLGREL